MISKLAIIQIGDNTLKQYEADSVILDIYSYPDNITEFELNDELAHLQEFYDGVIMQLPLPPHIRQEVATAAVDLNKLIIMEEENDESCSFKNK